MQREAAKASPEGGLETIEAVLSEKRSLMRKHQERKEFISSGRENRIVQI